jgi:pyruvate dehydrogenase E2 component (dihydrolipoamide acetyltransferase)/2-oxoisovalerate dehydrogenase E2 component (dihydrolipoyl transacylase)
MDFALPEIGEGVYEAELVSWLVKPGDTVTRGQGLVEVLTDKATMEVPAPFVGTVTALKAEPGQQIKVGEVLLSYTPAEQPAAVSAGPEKAAIEAVPRQAVVDVRDRNGLPTTATTGRLPLSAAPSVRHLARKLGIDLGSVQGTGPQGRILLEDLTRVWQPPGQPAPRLAEPRPDYGTPGTRIKLQGLRRKIAEHMALAKRTIPHYSYVDECDVTALVQLRESLREPFARAGVKLTYLAFVVKAVVAALKEVPIVNASLDEAEGAIVLHDRYHIGIAVATPGGLLVPVIHDADRKDLAAIARDVERLSSAARAGKARREDLLGGTFTITSVGNIGGLFSTPVIHHPEVGILGIGKVVKRPVFDAAGQVRPADLVYLSFSFDHRVVDGAVGAVFANVVLRELRNPAAMLLPAQL